MIDSYLNLQLYRSILCLNGHLPPATFFNRSLPIIATDGAANTLMAMNIVPDLVIGDLDSLEPCYATQLKTLYHYDQNLSDFQKSLIYLTEKNLLPAIIVGMNGGHLDHILNNINIFLQTDSILFAPPLIGKVLKAGVTYAYQLPLHTKISFLGIPEAIISSRGLKWELDFFHANFPGHNSCFNQTINSEIFIHLQQGTALMLAYLPDPDFVCADSEYQKRHP